MTASFVFGASYNEGFMGSSLGGTEDVPAEAFETVADRLRDALLASFDPAEERGRWLDEGVPVEPGLHFPPADDRQLLDAAVVPAPRRPPVHRVTIVLQETGRVVLERLPYVSGQRLEIIVVPRSGGME